MVGSHDPPTAVAAVQADRLETRTRYDTPGDGLGRAAVRRVLPAAHQGRRERFGPAVADPRAVRPWSAVCCLYCLVFHVSYLARLAGRLSPCLASRRVTSFLVVRFIYCLP